MTFVEQPASASLHLHVISMHTSPLAQPGSGDAGGMNVYIDRSLRALLAQFPQLSVEVFTLARQPVSRTREHISERAVVHVLELPNAVGASKEDLPALIDDFAESVQASALRSPHVIHAHYWLSGLAAQAYAPEVPLVVSMHTTAAGKDARAGENEPAEPAVRYRGEQQLVDGLAALVVNTEIESRDMQRYYGADPKKIRVIPPGVNTGIFTPLPSQPALHAGHNRAARVVFAGRPQPLKGPHLLVEALALFPDDLDVELVMIGRSGTDYETKLLQRATELGISQRVRLLDPLSPAQLAEQFRRADVVACPSSSETFGLVALEAQACGTPVLASAVDGLKSAVLDGQTGLLVAERTASAWADSLEKIIRAPHLRAELGQKARQRTLTMRWSDTAESLMTLYSQLSAASIEDTVQKEK